MRTHAFPGTLITLEGIDGAGKTQLLSALTMLLSRDGHTVVVTKEPGGTRIGRMLKTVLLEEEKECDPRVEFLLFAADRAEHFQKLVIPALMRGDIVISDRMADSALAYQGYGRGVDTSFIETVNTFAMHGINPDITLYLRISLEEALARRTIRRGAHSTMEQEGYDFWQRVAAGYEAIASKHARIHTLNAEATPEHVAQTAYKIIYEFLKNSHD
jgi:dTMP kinase